MQAAREGKTTVVCLTPPGRAAIAVTLVAGPRAGEWVQTLFRGSQPRDLTALAVGRILFGRWGDVAGEEVVLAKTAADRLEIHSHGGAVAAGAIAADLVARGAVHCRWQEWIVAESADSLQAEALLALAAACTERTAAILLDQYHGALGRAVFEIVAQLDAQRLAEAAASLDVLLQRAPLGRHLTRPFQVALAGPPNVGKSSLINRLLGFERAIVFDQPGTTRDVVTAVTAFAGWPVELSDTAGLRTTQDEIEREGVARALRRLRSADAIVLVFDATRGWSDQELRLCRQWPDAIVVRNKSDLTVSRGPGLLTSARTGTGLQDLQSAIVGKLVPNPPPPGSAAPFTTAHVEAIQASAQELRAGQAAQAAAQLRQLLAGQPG